MTAISWTDETWNPTVGCTRVSAGCINCYAEHAAAMVNRTQGERSVYRKLLRVVDGDPRWNGKVTFLSERLDIPLRWRKGRRVFVNSMSDLFHEKLTNEQIAAVFGVMASCPQHTFQVLTKRAARVCEWFRWVDADLARSPWIRDTRRPDHAPAVHLCMECFARQASTKVTFQEHVSKAWPLPNVHLGVSVENREAMLERAPLLMQCPAAVHFWSAEPLIGDLGTIDPAHMPEWMIVGCESGAGMRRCDPAWLRSLRDQCAAAGRPFFLKQAAEDREVCDEGCGEVVRYTVHGPTDATASCGCTVEGAEACTPVGVMVGEGSRRKKQGVIELPYLDGVQHAAFPEARS